MAVAVVLLIDFCGLLAWVASNQVPTDGFFVGAISANLIALFF